MEVESALPPVIVRLNHSRRRYAFRALKLSLNHPVWVEFEKAIQVVSERLELELNNSLDLNSQLSQTKLFKIQFENLVIYL